MHIGIWIWLSPSVEECISVVMYLSYDITVIEWITSCHK